MNSVIAWSSALLARLMAALRHGDNDGDGIYQLDARLLRDIGFEDRKSVERRFN